LASSSAAALAVSAVSLPQAADNRKNEARKTGRIRMKSMVASRFVVGSDMASAGLYCSPPPGIKSVIGRRGGAP
jgi:hypothetical protein